MQQIPAPVAPARPLFSRTSRRLSATPRRFAAAAVVFTCAWTGSPAAAGESPADSQDPAPQALIAPLGDGASLDLPKLDPGIPSPAAALGYPLGERFTHHGPLLAYLESLAAASPRVKLWRYGESYEGRPLTLLAISTPANLERLEEIRTTNLGLAAAGLSRRERERALAESPALVWLAYGIHGNESSSAEAALAAAYVLAAGGEPWDEVLSRVVVLLDPLQNPDGRERYVGAFAQRSGRTPDVLGSSFEHREPWPGGRTNHHWIDLNRDWAWVTQRETAARLAEYRRWEPQVFVDLHEMSRESSYYFPPAAEPIHPAVDPKVLAWFEVFGKANAKAFDSQGWLYYVGERFDLFYPGYGDSYPSLRGGVGMTYEVAGGGAAGVVVDRRDGVRLRLADRIARHLTSSLATVRTAAAQRGPLLESFAVARESSALRLPRTFLWRPGVGEEAEMAELLATHGVRVSRLEKGYRVLARPALGGVAEETDFPAGTYAVSTNQPLGRLIDALMAPEAGLTSEFLERQRRRVEDYLGDQFYDITAWALPLTYDVETWVVDGEPPAAGVSRDEAPGLSARTEAAGTYGFLIRPQGLAGYRFAAGLRAEEVRARLTLAPLRSEGRDYPAGTLFVPRAGNPPEVAATLRRLAETARVEVEPVASGWVDDGVSLGSDDVVPVRTGRIGLAVGPGTSPGSAGALWHLFDRLIEVPHHRFEVEDLAGVLDQLDVVVLPDGAGQGRRLGESGRAAVERWVRAGGTLVAIRRANDWLREAELVDLRPWESLELDEGGDEASLTDRKLDTPGVALGAELRRTHFLTAGLGEDPAFFFQGAEIYHAGDAEEAIVTVSAERPVRSGFAWPEVEERLAGAALVVETRLGSGRIVSFTQEPVFRLFWRGTAPALLNAVLYGPSVR